MHALLSAEQSAEHDVYFTPRRRGAWYAMLSDLVEGLASPAALRDRLHERLSPEQWAWIPAVGLSVASGLNHAAFQNALQRSGVHGNGETAPREVVVLDWSTAEDLHADGLASGAVLLRAFADRGIQVVCCPAQDPSIAAALASRDCEVWRGAGVHWLPGVPRATQGTPAAVVIAPVTIFSGANDSPAVGAAVQSLESNLEARGWGHLLLLSELVRALVQNVCASASASHAAFGAIVLPRKRPECVEIGIADDGAGARTPMTGAPRFSWLTNNAPPLAADLTPDTRSVEERAGTLGGVGCDWMSHALISEVLEAHEMALTIRSGSGSMTITSRDARAKLSSMTYGFGTQTLLTIRRPVR